MTGSWYELGGTIRAAHPAETRARVAPLFARLGITRVARLTGLDTLGVPVSVAIRPQGRLLSTALGKGITEDLADLSAIMESIETWHAEHLIVSAMGTSRQVGPTVTFGARPDEEIAWVSVRELQSGDARLAPAACFDLDTADLARDRLARRFRPTTTGLASGNTHDEALLHALCEVIERDAVARMDQLDAGACDERRIALSTITDDTACGLLDRFASAGFAIEVLDVTTAIGVPVFHVTILDRDPLRGGYVDRGMGAHLAPEIALVRALTEAAQSRLGYISGSRDDFWPDDYIAAPRIAPTDVPPPGRRSFEACRRVEARTWEDSIRELLGRIAAPVWVLDHERPELGVPVVHVRCPDLRDAAGTRA